MTAAGNGLPNWQAPAGEVAFEGWDAVVVGGGPAGAMTALHLADGGARVLLVERDAYPRDKACGDLLIPDTLNALRRAGLFDRVAVESRAVEEALIASPSRIEWTIPGEFRVLKRQRLDHLVAEGAAERGTVVARGKVEAVEVGRGGAEIRVRDVERPIRARTAVLATGADVSLLDEVGMLTRSSPTAVAVRSYVRSPVRLDPLFISFDREIVPGYAWIFPLPDDEYNVGVGVLHDPEEPARHDLRGLFDAFCAEVPVARELVEAAVERTRLRGARLRCGLEGGRPVGSGPVLAVGEQIGTTYPFTGEGIGKAMESGEIAAAAIRDALGSGDPSRLEDHARRVEEDLRPRYRGYEAAQRWLAHPWLNDLVSRRMRRSAFMQKAARGMVAETVDPREIFSFRGLLRSLVT